MRYLLDSDILSSYLRAEIEWVHTVENILPAGVSISSVTFMETLQGVLTKPTPIATEARFYEVVAGIPVLAFDEALARRCARMRHNLSEDGKRVRHRALDPMIATTAIEYNLVLVTRNRADYQDIPGIQLF